MARTAAMYRLKSRGMKLVGYKNRSKYVKRNEANSDISDRGRGTKKSRMGFNLALELGFRQQPSHFFKRTQYVEDVVSVTGSTGGVGFSQLFKLNLLPDFSDFTKLFDQYRIIGVNLRYVPKQNVNSFQVGPSSSGAGQLLTVIDLDDVTVPTQIDDILQYENMAMTTSMGELHQRCFKPAVDAEVYGAAATIGYSPRRNVWLDCNSSQVEHYGIRGWATAMGGSTAIATWDLYIDYFLEFRNTR